MSLEPIIPFEPVRVDDCPTGPEWTAQVKWDGVRVLTYFDGHVVRLYNRHRNERTFHYPELGDIHAYCLAKSVILDGEIIALKEGKPSFYQVMKRDGIRKPDRALAKSVQIPITYMVFDILYLDGRWVTAQPLTDRQHLLTRALKPHPQVQIVANVHNAAALFEAVRAQDMEGIVLKDLRSAYVVGGKDKRWQKKKFYREVIAVVGGVTFADTVANALLLGLYDADGQFWYIGHAGTGTLTQQDWRDFTRHLAPFIRDTMPFAQRPARWRDAIWLVPMITVRVQFAEWVVGHTLRQPSIQAFVHVDPQTCRLQ